LPADKHIRLLSPGLLATIDIPEQRQHAQNGEIVVALIAGSEPTLKRITQRPTQAILR
jgi:SOS-response transcriptional repressor LexA